MSLAMNFPFASCLEMKKWTCLPGYQRVAAGASRGDDPVRLRLGLVPSSLPPAGGTGRFGAELSLKTILKAESPAGPMEMMVESS